MDDKGKSEDTPNGDLSHSMPSLPTVPTVELTPAPDDSTQSTPNGSIGKLKMTPSGTSLPDLGNGSVCSRASLRHSMSLTHRRSSQNLSSQDIVSIHVERPIFTQEDFDEDFSPQHRHSKTVKERVKNTASSCDCSASCFKRFLFSILPFIRIMKDYNIKEDVVSDLISGLTVGVMHIPQGLAYGSLAMIPPVFGLYTSFYPVLIYFFFGTSKHISIGTFAVISLMVGSAVTRFEDECQLLAAPTTEMPPNKTDIAVTQGIRPRDTETEDPNVTACKVGVAMAVTFTAGLIQLGMGIFRHGFVTIYLSEPLTRAFTTGSAMHVFTSQVKHIFGIYTDNYNGQIGRASCRERV